MVIAFGVYNNSDNMRHIIKQSIIGALYIFAMAGFAAAVVIVMYKLAGR